MAISDETPDGAVADVHSNQPRTAVAIDAYEDVPPRQHQGSGTDTDAGGNAILSFGVNQGDPAGTVYDVDVYFFLGARGDTKTGPVCTTKFRSA